MARTVRMSQLRQVQTFIDLFVARTQRAGDVCQFQVCMGDFNFDNITTGKAVDLARLAVLWRLD